MDDFEDIFSTEALLLWASDSFSSATLNQTTAPIATHDDVAVNPAQQQKHLSDRHASCSDPTHQPRQLTLVNDISGLSPLAQNRQERKKRKAADAIPGCTTIKSTESQGSKSKRSKFQPQRKKEVAKTRRIGACLRCRQLKISCSEIWPCPPCRRSKSSCCGRASKFRWMDSVSCSFNDVDIYAIDVGCTPEQLTRKFINGKAIDFGDVDLAFESEVLWDLDAMVSEFAGWMSQKHAVPASTSRVGILSSPKFTSLLRPIANEDLIRTFRLLVESSSVLYNYQGQLDIFWNDYCEDDLESIRCFAGTSVLRQLERTLSNVALAETSLREMKALFLILFGTIIAVGYSRPARHNDEPKSSARSYGEAQQQLLRMLAHHMVQIAERTSILDQEADKIFLIERANHLWDRKAMFEWYMVSCNSGDLSDSDSSDEEGNGSGFESSTWEDDIAKVSTEPDPASTLQQLTYAQQFYAYQPDQILNPSSTSHGYDGPLHAGPEAWSDLYGQDPFVGAMDQLQHAQASLDRPTPSNYSVSEANKQFDVSQETAKGGLHNPMDHTSYQNMQHFSCVSCHDPVLWPEGSFCLTCINAFDSIHTTSSAGGHVEPTPEDAVPKNSAALSHRGNLSDVLKYKVRKARDDYERRNGRMLCPLYCSGWLPPDLLPPRYGLPPRDEYEGDKANISDTCARKPKNPLV